MSNSSNGINTAAATGPTGAAGPAVAAANGPTGAAGAAVADASKSTVPTSTTPNASSQSSNLLAIKPEAYAGPVVPSPTPFVASPTVPITSTQESPEFVRSPQITRSTSPFGSPSVTFVPPTNVSSNSNKTIYVAVTPQGDGTYTAKKVSSEEAKDSVKGGKYHITVQRSKRSKKRQQRKTRRH
jgi:hypothetical protein